jgi:hypothetical protein
MSNSRKIKKTYIDKKPKVWKDRDREDTSSDWDWKKELEKAETLAESDINEQEGSL